MDFEVGIIGLKIKSAGSIAKCIAIIRKYNPISMAEIKNAIEKTIMCSPAHISVTPVCVKSENAMMN
ncbi:MAG: hypothetical protein BWY61_01019 [Firmicutes bacterium ADurb.Bin354]|nr:MAG: hypothetical protein BWY61_01019 [Firmicutes bacterium ADurb.Bin354]